MNETIQKCSNIAIPSNNEQLIKNLQRNQKKQTNLLNDLNDNLYNYQDHQSNILSQLSKSKLSKSILNQSNLYCENYTQPLLQNKFSQNVQTFQWVQHTDQFNINIRASSNHQIFNPIPPSSQSPQKPQQAPPKTQPPIYGSITTKKPLQNKTFLKSLTLGPSHMLALFDDQAIFCQSNHQNKYKKYHQHVYQKQAYLQVNNKKWEKVLIKLNKQKFFLGPLNFSIDKIIKIKFIKFYNLPSNHSDKYLKQIEFTDLKAQPKIQKKNIIKIAIQDNISYQFYQINQTHTFYPHPQSPTSNSPQPSPQPNQQKIQLPLSFLTFSKIILRKLKQLHPKIQQTQWQPPQFPPKPIIIQTQSQTKHYQQNQPFIHGIIFKKSQHKGLWNKRYVIVNHSGLFSFKNLKDLSYSFFIKAHDIKYMWTWFDFLQFNQQSNKTNPSSISKQLPQSVQNLQKNNQKLSNISNPQKFQNKNHYLIVKIKHGINQTQFAIPICGFDNFLSQNKNWLYAFYKVLWADCH